MTPRQVHSPISLRARALACGRGDTLLIEGLDLDVEPGAGLLLRGPNGAGKSTLLLSLAGLLPPLGGEVSLVGHDPEDGPALHYCGHRNAVRPRLGVRQTLAFWRDINGPTGLSVDAALERVGLLPIAGLDAGYLSAGQQRRLALARLLVSRRPLWLLDEPTAALDTDGHRLVASLLAQHLEQGGLAVIATHDEIELPALRTLALAARA